MLFCLCLSPSPAAASRGENVVVELHMTLEELFEGATKTIRYRRNVLCSVCDGTGSKSGNPPVTCPDCNGRGMKVMTRQMGGVAAVFMLDCSSGAC